MNDYGRLKQKFDNDVKELRKHCPHTEWQWMAYEWAPGHFGGSIKVCLNCHAHLDTSEKCLIHTSWPKNVELDSEICKT